MSEPMTTHEIEDVLSSIRRLVSDDLRPAQRVEGDGHPPQTNPNPSGNVAGKLLLTPALRVVGTDDLASAEDDAPGQSTADAGDVVTRLGSGVADDDWESPVGDVGDWQDQGWGQSDAFASDDAAALHFVHRARADVGGDDFASDNAPESDRDIIDAPEAAFAPEDDHVVDQADVTFADDEGGSAWADQAEAEVMADLAQEVGETLADTLAPQADALMFDEEVLRDLVRDLIREELAGALGERITRNVRKLVRAEIARALAVQELE